MEEVCDSSAAASSTVQNQPQDQEHPWPYLREFFSFSGVNKDSFKMKCVLCLPLNKEISAFKSSPSNLRKHIERMHPNYLKNYSKLTAQKRKIGTSTHASSSKQLKVDSVFPVKHVSPVTVNKAILRYIIQGLHPFSTVDLPSFKELISALQPGISVITRPTLRSKIAEAALIMKQKVTAAMSEVEWIATTTDCWTARRKSFIGVTAHWINPGSLERHSAFALACKRLMGSHTFEVLASAMNDIHSEYEIRDKVVCTTTDSGSNFLKAFRVFGVENNDIETQARRCESDDTDSEGCGEGSDGVECQDASRVLDQDDGFEFQLPKHQKCACHLLNLVSSVDAQKALSNEHYKKLYRSVFGKCQALWNKSSRSALAAEAVESESRLQLLRPNQTRWNSTFMAVDRILQICKEAGEGALRNICTSLEVPMFNPAEMLFLTEWANTMRPVAKVLDILQAETNTQLGWLLPSVHQLSLKLQRLHHSLRYCDPLVDALQQGIQTRFKHMFEDPEIIAAAILLPKFRTSWTNDETIIKRGMDYIRVHLEPLDHKKELANSSSDDEDFFASLKPTTHEAGKELDGYLACVSDTRESLLTFPAMCSLSIKTNTPLPASAACERLFSTAGLLFSPKRARLDTNNFENQLLLKLNLRFYNFE
nr:putative transposase [Carassius auratus]